MANGLKSWKLPDQQIIAMVGIERIDHIVEEARKQLVQLIADSDRHGLRKDNRLQPAVLSPYLLASVVAFHETSGPFHGHRIDDRKEIVGI
jgi:hypothetical protein